MSLETIQGTMRSFEVKLDNNKKEWAIFSNGHALARLDSKQEAIDVGRALSKRTGEELIIYGKYGQRFPGTSMSEARADKMRKAIRKVGNLPNPDPKAVNILVESIIKNLHDIASSPSSRTPRNSSIYGHHRKA